jgi:5-methylcytosine-specific restriction endonuclease McrA
LAGTRRGRHQPGEATLVETCAGLGAAIGILNAVSHQMARPTKPRACSSAALRAGTCLNQQLSHDLVPYVKGGLLGLLIGGVASLVLVLLAGHLRRELAFRKLRAAIPTADSPGRSRAGSVEPPDPRRRRAIPERVRNEVWRRDEACCVDCGSRERLEFDHIIPISKGGSNTARNIELRCEICNSRKRARI